MQLVSIWAKNVPPAYLWPGYFINNKTEPGSVEVYNMLKLYNFILFMARSFSHLTHASEFGLVLNDIFCYKILKKIKV